MGRRQGPGQAERKPQTTRPLTTTTTDVALIRGKDGRERERREACVLHIECFSKGSWGSLTPIGSTSVRSTAYAFVYSCELLISEVSSALDATAPTLDGYYGLLAIALLVNADPPG